MRIFPWLLLFVPAAVLAAAQGASPTLVFCLSALAVVPLACYIGESTEELAARTTPAVGGLLNATFGNAPELIIGFFALRAGLLDVVKASITGSIVGELLFVLGLAMFMGGLRHRKQVFNRTSVLAAGSALFIAAIALIMPAVFVQTMPLTPSSHVQDLSILVSVVLLCIDGASLFFSLHTHKHLYKEVSRYEPRWSVRRAFATLVCATAAVAIVSELLVGSVTPVIASWGWTQLFIGAIVIAIIGNAGEHYSAVVVAMKNRMDLSLQIAIGSASQVAMVVAPLLVLVSLFLTPMSLVFNIFELVAIVVSVIAANLIVMDGESNWLEGAQLLAAYAIIGLAFFFHP